MQAPIKSPQTNRAGVLFLASITPGKVWMLDTYKSERRSGPPGDASAYEVTPTFDTSGNVTSFIMPLDQFTRAQQWLTPVLGARMTAQAKQAALVCLEDMLYQAGRLLNQPPIASILMTSLP